MKYHSLRRSFSASLSVAVGPSVSASQSYVTFQIRTLFGVQKLNKHTLNFQTITFELYDHDPNLRGLKMMEIALDVTQMCVQASLIIGALLGNLVLFH